MIAVELAGATWPPDAALPSPADDGESTAVAAGGAAAAARLLAANRRPTPPVVPPAPPRPATWALVVAAAGSGVPLQPYGEGGDSGLGSLGGTGFPGGGNFGGSDSFGAGGASSAEASAWVYAQRAHRRPAQPPRRPRSGGRGGRARPGVIPAGMYEPRTPVADRPSYVARSMAAAAAVAEVLGSSPAPAAPNPEALVKQPPRQRRPASSGVYNRGARGGRAAATAAPAQGSAGGAVSGAAAGGTGGLDAGGGGPSGGSSGAGAPGRGGPSGDGGRHGPPVAMLPAAPRRPASSAIAATPLEKLPPGCVAEARRLLEAGPAELDAWTSRTFVQQALSRQGVEAAELVAAAEMQAQGQALPVEARYAWQLLAQVVWETELNVVSRQHAEWIAVIEEQASFQAAAETEPQEPAQDYASGARPQHWDAMQAPPEEAVPRPSIGSWQATPAWPQADAPPPEFAHDGPSSPVSHAGGARRPQSARQVQWAATFERAQFLEKQQVRRREHQWHEKEKALCDRQEYRVRRADEIRQQRQEANHLKELKKKQAEEAARRRAEEAKCALEVALQKQEEKALRKQMLVKEVTEMVGMTTAVRCKVQQSNRQQLKLEEERRNTERAERAERTQQEAAERRRQELVAKAMIPERRAHRDLARKQAMRMERIRQAETEALRQKVERSMSPPAGLRGHGAGASPARSRPTTPSRSGCRTGVRKAAPADGVDAASTWPLRLRLAPPPPASLARGSSRSPSGTPRGGAGAEDAEPSATAPLWCPTPPTAQRPASARRRPVAGRTLHALGEGLQTEERLDAEQGDAAAEGEAPQRPDWKPAAAAAAGREESGSDIEEPEAESAPDIAAAARRRAAARRAPEAPEAPVSPEAPPVPEPDAVPWPQVATRAQGAAAAPGPAAVVAPSPPEASDDTPPAWPRSPDQAAARDEESAVASTGAEGRETTEAEDRFNSEVFRDPGADRSVWASRATSSAEASATLRDDSSGELDLRVRLFEDFPRGTSGASEAAETTGSQGQAPSVEVEVRLHPYSPEAQARGSLGAAERRRRDDDGSGGDLSVAVRLYAPSSGVGSRPATASAQATQTETGAAPSAEAAVLEAALRAPPQRDAAVAASPPGSVDMAAPTEPTEATYATEAAVEEELPEEVTLEPFTEVTPPPDALHVRTPQEPLLRRSVSAPAILAERYPEPTGHDFEGPAMFIEDETEVALDRVGLIPLSGLRREPAPRMVGSLMRAAGDGFVELLAWSLEGDAGFGSPPSSPATAEDPAAGAVERGGALQPEALPPRRPAPGEGLALLTASQEVDVFDFLKALVSGDDDEEGGSHEL